MRKTLVQPIRAGIEPGHVDHADGLTVRARTCTADAACRVSLDLHVVERTEDMPDAIEYASAFLLDLAARLRDGEPLPDGMLSPVWRRARND